MTPAPTAELPGARHLEHVMGMPVSIDLRDELPAATLGAVIDDVVAWLRLVDARFSTYRDDSQIRRLERGELDLSRCHPDVREVLDRCEALRAATRGYFSAWASGGLDPSGLVKGWALERASQRLAEAGSRDHCLNAGGDVRVRGAARPATDWTVGIRHPRHADALCAVVGGSDLAVATSGGYERGPHIVDPHEGRPVTGQVLRSVTIVGPDLAEADALATAAYAMQAGAYSWLRELSAAGPYRWLLVDAQDRLTHNLGPLALQTR